MVPTGFVTGAVGLLRGTDRERQLLTFVVEKVNWAPLGSATCSPDESLNEPWRNRTSNLLIKSQLLCQLS